VSARVEVQELKLGRVAPVIEYVEVVADRPLSVTVAMRSFR